MIVKGTNDLFTTILPEDIETSLLFINGIKSLSECANDSIKDMDKLYGLKFHFSETLEIV